jgi:hypothetical protein
MGSVKVTRNIIIISTYAEVQCMQIIQLSLQLYIKTKEIVRTKPKKINAKLCRLAVSQKELIVHEVKRDPSQRQFISLSNSASTKRT